MVPISIVIAKASVGNPVSFTTHVRNPFVACSCNVGKVIIPRRLCERD